MLTGSFTFSTQTIIKPIFNGFLLGIALKQSIYNNNFILFCLLVIPHGIFEISTIIIAGAAGFKIPYEIVRYLAGKKEQPLTSLYNF